MVTFLIISLVVLVIISIILAIAAGYGFGLKESIEAPSVEEIASEAILPIAIGVAAFVHNLGKKEKGNGADAGEPTGDPDPVNVEDNENKD